MDRGYFLESQGKILLELEEKTRHSSIEEEEEEEGRRERKRRLKHKKFLKEKSK